MTILGYIIVGFISFFAGVTLTCFLLAPKNLEIYSKYSNKTEESLKNNIALAKGAYKAYLKDETGESADEPDSAEESEETGDTEEGDTVDESKDDM